VLIEYVGISIILVGLVLMLVGVIFALREAGGVLGGAADFVDALTRLLRALAGRPQSTVLFTFGTLMVFLGGLIAGVSGLGGCI
jgi:hypothetical protein